MYYIGFTSYYFTLWSVTSERKFVNEYEYNDVTRYTYIQNLSHTEEGAYRRFEELYGNDTEVTLDLTIQGASSFERSFSGNIYPDTVFPNGRSRNQLIAESNDVWHLTNHANGESTEGRKANAIARLLELGEWVCFEGVPMHPDSVLAAQFAKYKIEEVTGWHHVAGSKVVLSVRLINEFHFSGMYGTTYVQTFQAADGKIYKYMGSSPVNVEPSPTQYYTLAATVKLDTYNEVNETKLLRIKVK